MNERIKQIRADLSFTQAELAADLNLSLSLIQAYEAGRRNPSGSVIYLICDKYKIRREWLVDGEGEMRYPEEIAAAESAIVSALVDDPADPVSEIVKEFMRTYISLDKDSREAVKKFASALLETIRNTDA